MSTNDAQTLIEKDAGAWRCRPDIHGMAETMTDAQCRRMAGGEVDAGDAEMAGLRQGNGEKATRLALPAALGQHAGTQIATAARMLCEKFSASIGHWR